MPTFKKLEKDFETSVEQLQESCKCSYKRLSLKDDISMIGCGSLFASMTATCKICNKKYIIFREDENISKNSPKIKAVLNKMIKNNYFRCWLKDSSQDEKIHFEER